MTQLFSKKFSKVSTLRKPQGNYTKQSYKIKKRTQCYKISGKLKLMMSNNQEGIVNLIQTSYRPPKKHPS